jgi:hypothetical protein
MIIKSKLLEKFFGEQEFAFPEAVSHTITSEFYGKRRKVGDELNVLVAKSNIKLIMYSHSGAYVKVGEEIRGMMPESQTASFKAGEVIRYGEWVKNPESYKDISAITAKITKVTQRPQSTGHEYYEYRVDI